jgi:hypothetical protein
MAKKNEKGSGLDKALERRVEEILESRLTGELLTHYAEAIYDNLYNGGEGCTEIDCMDGMQLFPLCPETDRNIEQSRLASHTLTGEGVIMLRHRFDDTREWIDTNNYIDVYASDAYATIGTTRKSETFITRGIWTYSPKGAKGADSYYDYELESLYSALIANDTYGRNNGPNNPSKDYDAAKDYAIITWFIRDTIKEIGGVFHLKFTEVSDVAAVKAFIAEMTGIMGDSDEADSEGDSDSTTAMPDEEVFKSLISKLTVTEEKKAVPRPPSDRPDKKKVLEEVLAKKTGTQPTVKNAGDDVETGDKTTEAEATATE